MSDDPQPFEEDLEAIEPEVAPDEAAEPELEPGKKGKKKKIKLARPKKVKKAKAKKPPRLSKPPGGTRVSLSELFPNVYTSLLGIAALAIIIAVILLAIEFFVHYGGERGPIGGTAATIPTAQTEIVTTTA